MPAPPDIALRALSGAGLAPFAADPARGLWSRLESTGFAATSAVGTRGTPDSTRATGSGFASALTRRIEEVPSLRSGLVTNALAESRAPSLKSQAPSRARAAAESLVAHALILPILKSLRETNNAAPPFAPGAHEKAFGSLADMQIADRLVHASRFPLVEAVEKWLTSNGEQKLTQRRGGAETGLVSDQGSEGPNGANGRSHGWSEVAAATERNPWKASEFGLPPRRGGGIDRFARHAFQGRSMPHAALPEANVHSREGDR